ncbi:UDP-N-acetylmuramate--L-alanine ligase [Candidatus Falkowbacteria bacterium]|nr:UDP-N-acetylmuramate--L-alanine ligase [Candidatus Falkowbacteria bacterium]
MDLSKIKKIYMIGIKGVGMTMLAQFLSSKGYEISGSDTDEKFMTDKILNATSISFYEGFSENNISEDADLFIRSSAYTSDNNIEVKKVLSSGKKVYTYAEILSEIFDRMYGLAVCGSHGKTTTTAWLGFVMMMSGLEPNVMVGSNVPQFKGAAITGKSDLLVIEADEYQNKLGLYQPKAVVLNNIDHDHHDFFPTKESYIKVFSDFVKKIPKKGFLVANFDDEDVAKVASRCAGKIISYGIDNDASLMAYDIKNKKGRQFFKVKLEGDELGDFSTSLLGKHNILNALAVIAASIELEIELKDIRTHLADFTGTERRMSVMGKFRGATIIDDYAHHPTEIRTTLDGLRSSYPDNKITVVFHPHTFTRTKALFDEFTKSFSQADKVIVLDIYGSAREQQGGVDSRELVDKVKQLENNKEILYIPTLKEAEEHLRQTIDREEIVVLMGAGDVFRIGKNLVE